MYLGSCGSIVLSLLHLICDHIFQCCISGGIYLSGGVMHVRAGGGC